jgi:hypothetical protein
MAKHTVPFSQSALLQAPLVITVPAAVLLASGSRVPIVAFGICALISYVFTLAMVGCLLLPALWLLSWVARIKTWLPSVIGGLLASLIFLAWDYSNWCSSGVDSGPAPTTYPQWIAKSWFTAEPLVVISFGVVTAAAYNFLATRKPNRSKEPTP